MFEAGPLVKPKGALPTSGRSTCVERAGGLDNMADAAMLKVDPTTQVRRLHRDAPTDEVPPQAASDHS